MTHPLHVATIALLGFAAAGCSESSKSKASGPSARTLTAAIVTQTSTAPLVLTTAPTEGFNDRVNQIAFRGRGLQGCTVLVAGRVATILRSSAAEVVAELPAGLAPGSIPVQLRSSHGAVVSGTTWISRNLADPTQVGAFAVGYRDQTFAGASGDTPALRLYYPALSAGANVALDPTAGPCPTVIYSHGYQPPLITFGIGYRQNAFIAEWLASFGYVVACVDQSPNSGLSGSGQQGRRGDAEDTIACLDALEAMNRDPNHPLVGFLAPDRAVFAGHSRGGVAALMAAAMELQGSARVLAAIAYAPPAHERGGRTPLQFGPLGSLPLLLIGASKDRIASPAEQTAIMALAGSPALNLEIRGGNHSQYKDTRTRIVGDGLASVSLAQQHDVCRRYTTAWLNRFVKGQRTLPDPFLPGGSSLMSDPHLAAVTSQ
jgi:pimeloyl-ACP methyl ester carboxylesterase